MLLFKVSIVMAVMLWLYQHASTLYKGGEIKKNMKALLYGQSKSLLHPRGPGGHKQSVMTSDLEHLPGFSPGIPVWYLPARAVAET